MIKITKIINHGGSCPFQIDASTDDDRMIYGRYRHGYLRVYIGRSGDFSEFAAVEGDLVFRADLGGPHYGTMTLEEFKEYTKEALDFVGAVDDNVSC